MIAVICTIILGIHFGLGWWTAPLALIAGEFANRYVQHVKVVR